MVTKESLALDVIDSWVESWIEALGGYGQQPITVGYGIPRFESFLRDEPVGGDMAEKLKDLPFVNVPLVLHQHVALPELS
jgi:hypothetical protein